MTQRTLRSTRQRIVTGSGIEYAPRTGVSSASRLAKRSPISTFCAMTCLLKATSTGFSDSTFSDTSNLLSVFAKVSLISTGNAMSPSRLWLCQNCWCPSSPNHPSRSRQHVHGIAQRFWIFDGSAWLTAGFGYFDFAQYRSWIARSSDYFSALAKTLGGIDQMRSASQSLS